MTLGQLFQVVGAIDASLKAHGLLDANGNYTKPSDVILAEDVALVSADVVKDLESQGVAFDPKVDKIVAELPAVITLVSGLM